MKVFVPHADDDAQAERVLEATCKFNKVPVPARRIRRIEYTHGGQDYEAEVGQPLHRSYGDEGQVVLLIVGQNPTLVCSANRGVARGTPVFVGKEEVRHIEYFD